MHYLLFPFTRSPGRFGDATNSNSCLRFETTISAVIGLAVVIIANKLGVVYAKVTIEFSIAHWQANINVEYGCNMRN